MLRMPVATLRVWERRYALTQANLSPSGQRLYTAEDVQRLALIKQLTDLGHAIGSLAPLDHAQLQQVAATHAQALAGADAGGGTPAGAPPAGAPWRLVVIGSALGARLRQPALQQRLGRPVELLGPFDDAQQAAAAGGAAPVHAVLVHVPHLRADSLAAVNAAPALALARKAVLYGIGQSTVCDALAAAGTALLRAPQPDAVLVLWLSQIASAARPAPGAPAAVAPALPAAPPPRRWDDAAVADFAGRSSTIACECPRHVAELLVQLSQFEAYSAECAHRSAADAALHQHLRQVAAVCRAQFEDALEHVAQHEGMPLPGTAQPG
jgi:DNA-binding transcriptional MerR regulator